MSRDGSLPAGVEHRDVDGHIGTGLEACVRCGDFRAVDSLDADQLCPECVKAIEAEIESALPEDTEIVRYCSREMALDAGCPEMEGMQIT